MSGFIISAKLTPQEAKDAIVDITRWFEAHPKRRVCRTYLGWIVRRGHVVVDVMLHTRAGTCKQCGKPTSAPIGLCGDCYL